MTSQDTTPDAFDDDPQDQRDLSQESSMEAAVDEGDDLEDGEEEPGSAGAYGTGVEGADQILEDERVSQEGAELDEFGDFEDAQGQDDTAAAEQGNRDEDRMVSEGDDAREVSELGGDDADIDAIGEFDASDDALRVDEGVDVLGDGAGISGDVDGEDPLAGGPTGR